MYPVAFPLQEHEWKVSIDLDREEQCFSLKVNNVPFADLPFQAQIAPNGPQLLEDESKILLNNKEAYTVGQWDNRRFQKKCNRLLRNKPLQHIHLDRLWCSSSEVVNQVFDQLGEALHDDQQLKSLKITNYYDRNQLENWTCQKLAHLAMNCEELELNGLYGTVESVAILVDMASTICQVSQCLRRLTLCETETPADVGKSFLSELADSEQVMLEYINFNVNPNWFRGNQECVDTLV